MSTYTNYFAWQVNLINGPSWLVSFWCVPLFESQLDYQVTQRLRHLPTFVLNNKEEKTSFWSAVDWTSILISSCLSWKYWRMWTRLNIPNNQFGLNTSIKCVWRLKSALKQRRKKKKLSLNFGTQHFKSHCLPSKNESLETSLLTEPLQSTFSQEEYEENIEK